MAENTAHPALTDDEQHRTDYACVVAMIAMADGEVTHDETTDLGGLCEQLQLDEVACGRVHRFAESPKPEVIKATLSRLRDSDLRFTLLTDMVVLGMADGQYTMPERKAIRGIAAAMGVDEDQVVEVEHYVRNRRARAEQALRRAERDVEEIPTVGTEVVSRLAAVGVPAAAVVAASPADELSYAALHAGLETMGLGLGAAPGVGVVFGLGVASFVGVRHMYTAIRQRQGEPDEAA